MQLTTQDQHILYSATTFRLLLDSLARPGKINRLEYPRRLGNPPSFYSQPLSMDVPVNFYALGALLTLLDGEVNFVVAVNAQWQPSISPVVQWLTLRSNASVAKPEAADFAFFCDGKSGGMITHLDSGTLLEPEESTTAFYCVEQLADMSDTIVDLDGDDEWLTLELSGPGIRTQNIVHVAGLDMAEIEYINATRCNYPLGIDVYLVDVLGRCVGLPRTTRIQISVPVRQVRG